LSGLNYDTFPRIQYEKYKRDNKLAAIQSMKSFGVRSNFVCGVPKNQIFITLRQTDTRERDIDFIKKRYPDIWVELEQKIDIEQIVCSTSTLATTRLQMDECDDIDRKKRLNEDRKTRRKEKCKEVAIAIVCIVFFPITICVAFGYLAAIGCCVVNEVMHFY
jgi:hypothetical protein